MSTRLAGRTRWSMAARCARMAALGLMGAEPDEPSERLRGRFQRGKDAQTYYGRRLRAKYGEENVEAERTIPWPAPPELPIGELHADFFIAPEAMTIEVKSSEAVDSMFESAMTQLAGEVHFDPESDHGALVFLDRDYQETDIFPLVMTDQWVETVEEIAAQVVESGKTGELPDRICGRPSDGLGHLCPFIDQCFEGWEAPPVLEMPDVAVAATEAYIAKRDLDAAKDGIKPLEARYDDAKQALLEAGVPEGNTIAGGVVVKHTIVRGSRRFSLSKAEKSGMWNSNHDEVFDAFISHSEGHSRWAFDRTEDDLAFDLGPDEDIPF